MFRDSNKTKQKHFFVLDAENTKRRRKLKNTTKLMEHKKNEIFRKILSGFKNLLCSNS